MIYVWELQSCFVKDIVAKYPQPAPPYTTVASVSYTHLVVAKMEQARAAEAAAQAQNEKAIKGARQEQKIGRAHV